MYKELVNLEKNHQTLKTDLNEKLDSLRSELSELEKREIQVVLPDPKHVTKRSRSGKEEVPDHDDDNNAEVKSSPKEKKQANSLEAKILKLRKRLPALKAGEEVLAKWEDDGWYYRSIVKESLGNHLYKVEDSLKDDEKIYREDIVSEIDDSTYSFKVGDTVVGLHPDYDSSYAPGQVEKISNDQNKILIKFYDFVEAALIRQEVFKLPTLKFQIDVDTIIRLEEKWVGEVVIARNNFTNVYELGTVKSRVGKARQYVVEWSSGKESIQNANHIFGQYTRRPELLVNDYILAPRETIFLPGRVMGRKNNRLKVKFLDGSM